MGDHLQKTTKPLRKSSRHRRSRHHAPDTTLGHRTSSSEPSQLPDFLKDMEFRSTGSYHLPVIDLPPSPPISFSSESDRRRAHTLQNEIENQNPQIRTMDTQIASAVSNEKGPLRIHSRGHRCGFFRGAISRRRFGRRTKNYWQKARSFLRR